MPTRDDSDLARATLAGDRRAFDELLDRYETKIYNLALRVTGNPADAMDVTQAAFLKAYENLQRYDPGRPFFSWIYRIGMNEALDTIQDRRRFLDLDPELASRTASPEQDCAAHEAGRKIQDAMLELPAEQRAVIVLRHFQGLSYQEIAEVIGVPLKRVKSRLFEARTGLRERLARRGLGH